jgi:hypothetical protein
VAEPPKRARARKTPTADEPARQSEKIMSRHRLGGLVSPQHHYAIHYAPVVATPQTMDVQALTEQTDDPWHNQTLIQIGPYSR